MTAKEQNRPGIKFIIFLLIAFAALYAAVADLYPLYDDWTYYTVPLKHFSPGMLKPDGPFWRPFDVLYGVLLGYIPWAFPWLNKVLIVASHIVCVYYLDRILSFMDVKKNARIFSVCFFCFSPGVWSVAVSPDALNQSFSLMFGVMSVYAYLKRKRVLYIILCVIALMVKESGVTWFFVAPLIDIAAEKKSIRSFFGERKLLWRTVIYYAVSLALIAVYFVIRFSLQGNTFLGLNRERYAVSFSPLRIIKNIVILAGGSFAGLDSVSFLLGDSYIPGIITAVLSAAFLVYVLYLSLKNRKKEGFLFAFIIFAAIIAASALPHSIMVHPSEMNGYPTVFAFALFYGYVFGVSDVSKKAAVTGCALLAVCFVISGAHKLMYIYDYSSGTRELSEKMSQYYDDPDDRLLVIALDKDFGGYSCFVHSPAFGTNYGACLKQYVGWENIRNDCANFNDHAEAAAFAESRKDHYDKVWIIDENSEIIVVK